MIRCLVVYASQLVVTIYMSDVDCDQVSFLGTGPGGDGGRGGRVGRFSVVEPGIRSPLADLQRRSCIRDYSTMVHT